MRFHGSPPPQGLLRRVAFGQEALYRVVTATPETVDVEVLSAPGLPSGTRVRFTTAAARAMQSATREPSAKSGHRAPALGPRGAFARFARS